jgi:hypothetical protein
MLLYCILRETSHPSKLTCGGDSAALSVGQVISGPLGRTFGSGARTGPLLVLLKVDETGGSMVPAAQDAVAHDDDVDVCVSPSGLAGLDTDGSGTVGLACRPPALLTLAFLALPRLRWFACWPITARRGPAHVYFYRTGYLTRGTHRAPPRDERSGPDGASSV